MRKVAIQGRSPPLTAFHCALLFCKTRMVFRVGDLQPVKKTLVNARDKILMRGSKGLF